MRAAMKSFRTKQEVRDQVRAWRREGLTVGLVPTMGYLHEGHLSLMRIAKREADRVVASVFVNPTQFGPNEDFAAYPRDEARDLAQCESVGIDGVFLPEVSEMYRADATVHIVEDRMSKVLCGITRPIHFGGVLTVVDKLFNIVTPDVAVFGQKDAQQALVIRRMVRDLNFPIEIVVSPLIRDTDGVAMSSRNTYLSPSERERARVLNRSLAAAREALLAGKPLDEVRQETLSAVTERADRVDYVEFLDSETLEPATAETGEVLIALAAVFGHTRLIDNTLVRLKPQA